MVSQEPLTKKLISKLLNPKIGYVQTMISPKVVGLLIILALLFPLVSVIDLVDANPSGFPTLQLIPTEKAYIRGNGTIEPSTLPIERSGNRYTLTDDIINYTIEIQTDNIVFDGNGHSLIFSQEGDIPKTYMGNYGGPALLVANRTNILVRNVSFVNSVTGAFTGIHVVNSSNIIIFKNIAQSVLAVYVEKSSQCSIIGNVFTNHGTGVGIFQSTFVFVAYNDISGMSNGINLREGSNINVTINELTNNEKGILIHGSSSNNIITENNFRYNDVGLLYKGSVNISDGDTIFNNYWSDNEVSILNLNENGKQYAVSAIDQDPLAIPVLTSFDPTLFPLPTYADVSLDGSELDFVDLQTNTLLLLLIITSTLASIILIAYAYRHKMKRTKKM